MKDKSQTEVVVAAFVLLAGTEILGTSCCLKYSTSETSSSLSTGLLLSLLSCKISLVVDICPPFLAHLFPHDLLRLVQRVPS